MSIPRGIRAAAGPVLGALLTLAALYLLGWISGPTPPAYTDVVVDSATIVQGEPDPDVGRLEGIIRPRVEPEVRATAPGAAASDVAALCLAAGYARPDTRSAPGTAAPGPAGGAPPGDALPYPAPELAEDRSAGPVPPAPAATFSPSRSGLPPALRPTPAAVALIRSGRVGLRETELWLVRSSGDLVRESYRVRPPVTFRVNADSVVVQGSRFWWLRPLASIGLCAAGGYVGVRAESAVPVAVGCGAGFAVAVR